MSRAAFALSTSLMRLSPTLAPLPSPLPPRVIRTTALLSAPFSRTHNTHTHTHPHTHTHTLKKVATLPLRQVLRERKTSIPDGTSSGLGGSTFFRRADLGEAWTCFLAIKKVVFYVHTIYMLRTKATNCPVGSTFVVQENRLGTCFFFLSRELSISTDYDLQAST